MIPYGRHSIDESDILAVSEVLRSGFLTQGPAIDAFERSIADYTGAKFAVAVSSCTAGLHLAALAAGVGPGTLLVTSPITFVASANSGIYAGARVAFADIDGQTVNISAESLELVLARTPDAKAVVAVHFAGLPCNMEELQHLCRDRGVALIEDAAHALGARYGDGQRVGSCQHSDMTVFSFHPVKAVAAGEGGMVTTNDESLYRRLLRLRSHGINKLDDAFQLESEGFTNGLANPWYYEMQELGFHYRITDIQCALGMSQLRRLESFLERRRALVARYDEAFSAMKFCRPAQLSGRKRSGHHIYVLRIDFKGCGTNRAELMTKLRARGIGTQVHYIPVPLHPFYRASGHNPEDFPEALRYYREALSIPLFVDLSDEEQNTVIQAFSELVG